MIRRRFIFFLLLASLLLNVLIAWFCAGLPQPMEFDPRGTAITRRALWDGLDESPDPVLERRRIRFVFRGLGRDLVVINPDTERNETLFIHRAGWPFRCLTGRVVAFALPPDGTGVERYTQHLSRAVLIRPELTLSAQRYVSAPGSTAVAMLPFAISPAPAQVLPYQPLWGGTAWNLLSYLGLIVALWTARLATVGAWRRIRGQCPHCGYDLRGAPPGPADGPDAPAAVQCPECGRRSPVASQA